MSNTDFTMQVNLRPETVRLLEAAKSYAEFQEEDRDLSRDRFRAGNGTFSNDKILFYALKNYVPRRFID